MGTCDDSQLPEAQMDRDLAHGGTAFPINNGAVY